MALFICTMVLPQACVCWIILATIQRVQAWLGGSQRPATMERSDALERELSKSAALDGVYSNGGVVPQGALPSDIP